jgi:hypothetical protein
MKFYCIRDFAGVIGLLKDSNSESFVFAADGEFVEPNEELLNYAFTASTDDAIWEDFVEDDEFAKTMEGVIGVFKARGIRIGS